MSNLPPTCLTCGKKLASLIADCDCGKVPQADEGLSKEIHECFDTYDCPFNDEHSEIQRKNGHEWQEYWCCETCMENKLQDLINCEREKAVKEFLNNYTAPLGWDDINEIGVREVLSKMFPSEVVPPCSYCDGKKTFSRAFQEQSSDDFGGEESTSPVQIEHLPCKHCKGTGVCENTMCHKCSFKI